MSRETAFREALDLPWVRQGDWAGSLLFRGHVFLGLQREVPAWTGIEAGTRAFLQAGPATWLVEGEFERFAEGFLAAARADPQRILGLAARFEGLLADVQELERALRDEPRRGGTALADLAERYAALDMDSQPYSYVFGYGEDAIVGRLVRDLVERTGTRSTDSAAAAQALLLPPPDVPTDMQAAQDALLAVAEVAERVGLRSGGALLQPRAVRDALAAHVARFGYLGGDADAVLASARVHVGRAAHERARRRTEVRDREASREASVLAMRLGPEDRALLDGLRRQVGLRTARRELWLRVRAAYEPHLGAMARHLRIPSEVLHLLTHEELAAALRGAPLPDLATRAKGSALLAHGRALHVFTGPQAVRLHAHAEGGEREEVAEVLTGLGANPGTARGPVRIVRGAREAAKVVKGDILVTDMTEPDLVLACERAAAIVTDLGGMLCHAAIVSRELGIPCVLGTGKATRWLRDGDLVEVDGEAGRVVVLQRPAGQTLKGQGPPCHNPYQAVGNTFGCTRTFGRRRRRGT